MSATSVLSKNVPIGLRSQSMRLSCYGCCCGCTAASGLAILLKRIRIRRINSISMMSASTPM